MRKVVLESPYQGDIERNIGYARKALRDCLVRGDAPMVSHLLYTQPGVLNDANHVERHLGMQAGFAWYADANACVVYEDYGISKGMERGIAYASGLGIPVEYRKLFSIHPK